MIDSPPSESSPTNPTLQRLEHLALGDRNVALAMAVLLEIADVNGATTFGPFVSHFREAVLDVMKREGRDRDYEAAKLTLETVSQHLGSALMPRLVEGQLVERSHDNSLDPQDLIRVAPDVWASVAEHAQLTARRLRSTGEHVAPLTSQPESAARPPNPSVLSAEGLVKVYRGRRVVNDVALRVAQGEIVGLLGPNGAGKTTTFYMLVGLISPQAGSIVLEDEDITKMPMYKRARRGIGYLSQEPSIFRKLTVEQNILAILETLPLSGAERKARLETLLDELGIKHLRASNAYQLSGGERRRLEITRALVTQPKFMMLDEPFAGVDPLAVHDIQTIVANLRYRGIGVLISDHNVEQTLDIVDRAYIMIEGKVKVSGTVRELVFDDTVARDYLGPTLAARLRARFAETEQGVLSQ